MAELDGFKSSEYTFLCSYVSKEEEEEKKKEKEEEEEGGRAKIEKGRFEGKQNKHRKFNVTEQEN